MTTDEARTIKEALRYYAQFGNKETLNRAIAADAAVDKLFSPPPPPPPKVVVEPAIEPRGP